MSSKASDKDKPLPLITVENGKFVVHDEALKRISAIQGPVGVIAIAGLYRSGKSYVMNRLLGRQHGFEVGPTINACTKGIYVWGEPVTLKGPDGENVSYILIDTEGLGSIEQSQTYDAKIFSLAILFSSYFIYNSMGVIDETAIDKLSLVTNLTKHVQISEGHIERSASAFSEYFPQFVWLVRDFSLQLVDPKGHPITSRQYLDNALAVRSSDPSKNQIRDTIMQAFPSRDCYTLVRPVIDEKQLQAIDRIPFDKLRPEFRAQIEEFKSKVFLEAGPKKIAGRKLNGAAVSGMIAQYVAAINSGKIPTISSAWEHVVDVQNRKAVAEASAAFKAIRSAFKELPVEDAELSKANDAHQKKAREVYYRLCMGDNHGAYIADLEHAMTDEYAKLIADNRAASDKSCKALLSKLFEPIGKKVRAKTYEDQSEFDQDLQEFWKSYAQQSKGPLKESSRIDFDQTQVALARASVTAQLQDRARAELEEQKKRAADAEKRATRSEMERDKEAAARREAALKAEHQIDTLRRELDAAKQDVADLKAQIEANRKKADAKLAALTKERDDLTERLGQERKVLDGAQRDKAARDADVQRLQQEIDQLQSALKKSRQDVQLLSDQKEGQTRLKSVVEERLAQAEKDVAQLTKELEKKGAQYTEQTKQELAKYKASLAERDASIQLQSESANEELSKLRSDLEESRKTASRLQRALDTKQNEAEELVVAVKAANDRADKMAAELSSRPVAAPVKAETSAPDALPELQQLPEPSHDAEDQEEADEADSPENKRRRRTTVRDSIRVTPAKSSRKSEAPSKPAADLDDLASKTVDELKGLMAKHKIPGAPIQRAKKQEYVDLINKWKTSKGL